VRDTLGDGRAFRALTIVDDCTRDVPAIEVDFSLPGARVLAVLDRLARTRGIPKAIVCDNGPEFAGETFDERAYVHNVALDFIVPESPRRMPASTVSMPRSVEECLNENWFVSLADAQATIEAWRIEYDTERPHRRLRDCTPREFALNLTSPAVSSINASE